MPTRFRKSVKIAPGVKVNIGKKGISSVSFGGKYMRQTVGGGRKTTSVSIPGTGVGFYKTTSTRPSARQRTPPPPPASPAKPGLFAPPVEKRFYEGLEAYRRSDWQSARNAFAAASAANQRAPSPYLFGALIAVAQGDYATATSWLEWVVENASLPDDLMSKYAANMVLPVRITERVAVRAPLEGAGPPLALAELYQETGRREEAIGLMQQMHEANSGDAAITLSLADLLYEDGDDDGVVELAAGVTNDSDVALGILHLKAKALLRSGVNTAAVNEFTACLKKTSGRDPDLLREIRYDRAAAYESVGQLAKARAEFEKLYAEDPGYRDVRDRLRSSAS